MPADATHLLARARAAAADGDHAGALSAARRAARALIGDRADPACGRLRVDAAVLIAAALVQLGSQPSARVVIASLVGAAERDREAGRLAQAEFAYREVIGLRLSLVIATHQEIAATLIDFATLLVLRARPAEAKGALRRALAILGGGEPADHWLAESARRRLADLLDRERNDFATSTWEIAMRSAPA